jgi:hypothetical protein
MKLGLSSHNYKFQTNHIERITGAKMIFNLWPPMWMSSPPETEMWPSDQSSAKYMVSTKLPWSEWDWK